MVRFLGFNIVVVEGVPNDQCIMTSIDRGAPGGDQTAVVVASLQDDGRWRIDAMLDGREAQEAFGRASIGLNPIKLPTPPPPSSRPC